MKPLNMGPVEERAERRSSENSTWVSEPRTLLQQESRFGRPKDRRASDLSFHDPRSSPYKARLLHNTSNKEGLVGAVAILLLRQW